MSPSASASSQLHPVDVLRPILPLLDRRTQFSQSILLRLFVPLERLTSSIGYLGLHGVHASASSHIKTNARHRFRSPFHLRGAEEESTALRSHHPPPLQLSLPSTQEILFSLSSLQSTLNVKLEFETERKLERHPRRGDR